MGTIDQKLNNYIWNNINILEVVFSEKIYKILLRFKEKNDKESFSDTLEALVEVDSELLEKVEVIYQNYPDAKLKLEELSEGYRSNVLLITDMLIKILGRKAEEITIIKEIDGEIIAQKGEGTESMDVSNVLLQYFDVDSVVGKPMQDKIRRFNELRVNNDTNNEEYKRLNQEILNSEFGVLTLDSDYLEYLKSKKRKNPPQNRNFDNIGDFL